MKRALTFILTLALLVSAMAFTASAAVVKSGSCGARVTYTLTDDGVMTISGSGPMDDYTTSYKIPWNWYKSDITTLVVEEGVTSLGKNTFYNCTNLESVSFPSTLTSIGYAALNTCPALTELVIPDSVTFIDEAAFANNDGLTSITIPGSVSEIPYRAFAECEGLTSVVIEDGVTSIGERAFYSCDKLTSVTIADSVTTIGEYAFAFDAMESVKLPASLTEIGEGAFKYIAELQRIEVPASLTTVGEDAFADCDQLSLAYYYGTEEQWASIFGSDPVLSDAGVFYVEPGTCSHMDQNFIDGYAATCTEDGLTVSVRCYMCDATVYEAEIIPATGHSMSAWTITKEPTATEPGQKSRSCQTCGYTETADISANANPFEDVKETDFFHDPVIWAYGRGITNGYGSDTIFAPNADCTRGQVVTFLWRAAGEPTPKTTSNPFTDVKETDYFYKAVLWAVENGITAGYGSDTIFNPSGVCTRGQFVTFLWRTAGKPEVTSSAPFSDIDTGDYFFTPVVWATKEGYCTGTGNACFSPDANCNRGQTVTFLYRYYANAPVTAPAAIALNHSSFILADVTYLEPVLTGTVMPDSAAGSAITWTTSDPSVVTVAADGTLTAVGPGTATVAAHCGNAIAYCTVEVPEYDCAWFVEYDRHYLIDHLWFPSTATIMNPRAGTYVNSDGQLCVITINFYKAMNLLGGWDTNFYTTLHNLETGETIREPSDYYDKKADNAWGQNKLYYMGLVTEYLEVEIRYEEFPEWVELMEGYFTKA